MYFQTSRDITSHTPLTQAVELDRADIIKLLLTHPAIDSNMKVRLVLTFTWMEFRKFDKRIIINFATLGPILKFQPN